MTLAQLAGLAAVLAYVLLIAFVMERSAKARPTEKPNSPRLVPFPKSKLDPDGTLAGSGITNAGPKETDQ